MQSSMVWKVQFLGIHSFPQVFQKPRKCKLSCWHTPGPLLSLWGCPGRSPALCSWHSPPPRLLLLPLPCLLLLSPPPQLTGIPLVMVQGQGRSPLASPKFLGRLGERRMSPHEFQCLGTAGWIPCPARKQPGTRLISPGGIMCSPPPSWELLNQKKK